MLRLRPILLVAWLVFGVARVAQAGMPAVGLSEVARLRFQTISFFLVVLLLSAWAVRGLWNGLGRDFPRLPPLSYGRAVGLVALWGCLFIVVLTMISGARELLTPGAWERAEGGWTYQLRNPPPADDGPNAEQHLWLERCQSFERLRTALLHQAALNGGRFPLEDELQDIPERLWQPPGRPGLRYRYIGGQPMTDASAVIAHEPDVYAGPVLVMRADGSVDVARRDEVEIAAAEGGDGDG